MAEEREGGDREQRRWKEDGGGGGGFVHRPGGGVCVCAGAYGAQEKSSLQWVSACPCVLAFDFPKPA